MVAFAIVQTFCISRQTYAGSLTGSVATGRQSDINLTLQGTVDWAVWGQGSSASLTPTDRKLGGSAISALTDINKGDGLRGLGQFGSYGESTFDWTNGTQNTTATNVYSGLQHDPLTSRDVSGEGFSFTVPASLTMQVVTLYFTNLGGPTNFTATLSDSSAPMFNITFTPQSGGNVGGILTLDFATDSLGQTLVIQGVLASGSNGPSNVAFQGVTLAPVPEPATYVELTLGAIAFVAGPAWRKIRQRVRC